MLTPALIAHINTLSHYLAADDGAPVADETNGTAYVLAGSAILHTSRALFNYLDRTPGPHVLVIAGGIGHSTSLLYDAVRRNPAYAAIEPIDGLAEARIIERLMRAFWSNLATRVDTGEVVLLVDDKSRSCGENAELAKGLLNARGIIPERIVLVQDPTMSRRTGASLEKHYRDDEERGRGRAVPRIHTWPTVVPQLATTADGAFEWSEATQRVLRGGLEASAPEGRVSAAGELWSEKRFIDLLLGEIPRLRDDAAGYGPKGTGFIIHVDLPPEVEHAHRELAVVYQGSR